jgi:hypothetical protein
MRSPLHSQPALFCSITFRSRQQLHRVPGELNPVLWQYGITREARTPEGKGRARSNALLKLQAFARTGVLRRKW